MIEGILARDRVIAWDKKAKNIFESSWTGKTIESRTEFSLIEAAMLLENRKIKVTDEGKKMPFKKFYEYCKKVDPRFRFRYAVYKDLRSRDLPVRTGFKFGCDFRVYEKGVKPLKRGPKATKEHTKWVVFAVPRNFEFSFQELSRAVRLAHNIRANMLWGVVDADDKVKYFQVQFFKP